MSVRTLLSAPSPAGVDGLDGPDYGDGPIFEGWAERSGSEALGVFAALPPIPGHEITAEFDKQAQRIGELEGLLRMAVVESAQLKRCNGVFQGKGQRKANKANRWR